MEWTQLPLVMANAVARTGDAMPFQWLRCSTDKIEELIRSTAPRRSYIKKEEREIGKHPKYLETARGFTAMMVDHGRANGACCSAVDSETGSKRSARTSLRRL